MGKKGYSPLDIRKAEDEGSEDMSFLQSAFWAEFKSGHGWAHSRLDLRLTDSVQAMCSVLLRSFPFGTIAYAPMGPILDEGGLSHDAQKTGALLSSLAHGIASYLGRKLLCMRFDLPIYFTDAGERDNFGRDLCRSAGICRAPAVIQPEDTVILPLTDNESLLAGMKPKWRYNIRLAEKKGVRVRQTGIEAIETFYELYRITAARDGIAIHAKSYYADLLGMDGSQGSRIRLYIAEYDGAPLAAIITLFYKKEAVYLYGASSNEQRNLMPAYLLQWTAMQDARDEGCTSYDFYGIPPCEDKNHPMYGLYRFKTGFGGNIVHRPYSIDIPLSPLYGTYAAAERLRSFYFKRIKKLLKPSGTARA